MTNSAPSERPHGIAENDALTKDDLRALRRLAVAHRDGLRQRPETTADVQWAWDTIVAKLDRATSVTSPAETERPGGDA